MIYFDAAYSTLAYYLTIERIEEANQVFEINLLTPTDTHTDKSHWYAVSYPEIIKIFEETRYCATQEAWVKRLAMVSAWLPTILSPNFQPHVLEELNWLEEQFCEVKLEKVKVGAYLGRANILDDLLPPVLIKNLVSAAHQLTGETGAFDSNLSTTTKILHFMHPHLFPIYDLNIHRLLFRGEQTYKKYHAYVFALKKWLETNKNSILPTLERLARKHEVSVIRMIDHTLFHLVLLNKTR